MKHYIDKSAVIAEIEKRKEKCDTFYDIALSNNAEFAKVAIEEQKRQYNSFLSFLDTLEVKEESISDELEVELEKYIKDHFTIDIEQLDRFGIEEEDYMYSMDKSDMLALVEHFTKWKEQQMMKNSVECTVHVDVGGYPYIGNIELYDYENDKPLAKAGDKVKVIINN